MDQITTRPRARRLEVMVSQPELDSIEREASRRSLSVSAYIRLMATDRAADEQRLISTIIAAVETTIASTLPRLADCMAAGLIDAIVVGMAWVMEETTGRAASNDVLDALARRMRAVLNTADQDEADGEDEGSGEHEATD